MPIFEYTCEDCGTAFEKLVRASSENGVACPSCGEHHVKKEFSSFAARATSGESAAPMQMGGGCPAGMCQTPGMCGRNN
jgi:putative FmdB family regulatory protein